MKKLLLIGLLLFTQAAFAFIAPQPMQHSPNTAVTVSVTNSSTTGIAANVNRTGLVCTNVGAANVSLSFNGAALNNYGITLIPGVSFVMDDYSFTTQPMTVISPTSSTLSCQEYQ